MRKITIYLGVLAVSCLQIAICSQLHAQGVGVNTAGNPADNSAMLDVSGTNKGVLIPRMTTAQMNAISTPATGLIIYNTDCNNLNYNAGTPGSPNWVTISSTVGTPGNITGSASVCANQAGITYSIAAVSGASSYNWTVPTGATITAGTGTSSITVTFGTNGGSVCVSTVNSCGTSNASCITVTVYNNNLTAGTISNNQTICSGATPSALTFTTPPTGGTGIYTYQWYNGTGSLGSAATNSTYSPGAMTAAGIISTESFDGTTFPPTGWATTVISDPDCPGSVPPYTVYCPFDWMRTTASIYVTPHQLPHSGAGEAWYDSWDAAVGDEAILVSPSFSETGNISGATVSFWFYESSQGESGEGMNVWYSTSSSQPTSTSGATLLGFVSDNNLTNGWYQYTYTIPSSVTSSTVWLIFEDVSKFDVEIYLDDVSWTALPSTTTTNYYCSVTSGCTVTTNTVTLSVNALPPASITGTTAICSGNSTTLTASGGGTYLWSTGDTTAAITESPTSTTTYTVTVTNGAGCSATASATVTVNTGVPTPPVAGTNTASFTQLVWNWSTVSGATGYQWNTTSTYPGIGNNVVTSNSYTQTGITCNTSYTLYVWAYNSCGNSSSYTTLTQLPLSWACGCPFTVIHTTGSVAPVTETVTYGTVSTTLTNATECWITQNLGATHQAISATDATDAAAGWYWEWDTQQGYYLNSSNSTLTPSWADTYGTDASWVTANDPCNLLLGSGWRIPTYTEWNNANTNGWTNDFSAYASVLKIHAAGGLWGSHPSLFPRGYYGYYWSSTVYSSSLSWAWSLDFLSGYSAIGGTGMTYGFLLRCLNP